MDNKKAKQMICDFYNKKHNCHTPYFGCFFDAERLMIAFPDGYGPDGYFDNCEKLELGTVSIKGKV